MFGHSWKKLVLDSAHHNGLQHALTYTTRNRMLNKKASTYSSSDTYARLSLLCHFPWRPDSILKAVNNPRQAPPQLSTPLCLSPNGKGTALNTYTNQSIPSTAYHPSSIAHRTFYRTCAWSLLSPRYISSPSCPTLPRTPTLSRSPRGATTSGDAMISFPEYLSTETLPLTTLVSPTSNSEARLHTDLLRAPRGDAD